MKLTKRLFAEGLGTALLIISVVGSGIMATNLTEDVALQLLANSGATVGADVRRHATFGVSNRAGDYSNFCFASSDNSLVGLLHCCIWAQCD